EDLKVENMSRSSKGTKDNPDKNVAQKRGLNRSQAWTLFRKRLKDKAASATSPVLVIPINPKHTSQTCPQCEEVAKDNRKSQAVFSCIVCGHTANADINTAKNILTTGLGPLWGVTGRRWTLQQKPIRAEHSGPVKRQPPEGLVA
ncbi:MAG: transposase, partial [Actinobacteria bacterium]|nr:transposase [Actinomycetota bacterium]